MSTSETYIKATLNRLKARIGNKVTDSISEVASLIKEAPDLITKELDLLTKEILDEASRLEKNNDEQNSVQEISFKKEEVNEDQNRIDRIRMKISQLANQIE